MGAFEIKVDDFLSNFPFMIIFSQINFCDLPVGENKMCENFKYL
jgi:hypothetical protein